VERLLGVPEGVRVVELVPVGYPAEQPKAPRRKELSEIVHLERYGRRV
jgi:nitroreductase